MEYYSVLNKEIVTYGKTGMDLENTMLSQVSWPRKDGHCESPLIWGSWSSQHLKR